MNRRKEIEARLAAIRNEINTRGTALTDAELTAFETEVKALTEERDTLDKAAEKRAALLASIAAGEPAGDGAGNPVQPTVLRSFGAAGAAGVAAQPTTDAHDTVAYRTAFMNYVCRGVEIPRELRVDATTTVADSGAVIPTSIMNEIITKLESYGNLYAQFRKINVQGGVAIPIADLKPTANWITEDAPSSDQKLSAKTSVTFNYYGLECKLAQSILANVVTLEMFNNLFVPLATEAMVKAIEIASINGDGAGKPLGVTKDTRITTDLAATNVITLTPAEYASWDGWHKAVKAKIKKAYRNGAFIMNQGTFDSGIDGMVDSNKQPVGRTNYGINGEETYRFMGKAVETVDDDILPSWDDAAVGDVVAVYMKLSDYVINTNMQMTTTKWVDNDTNKVKNKCMMVVDGKAADVNGILIIKKGAAV